MYPPPPPPPPKNTFLPSKNKILLRINSYYAQQSLVIHSCNYNSSPDPECAVLVRDVGDCPVVVDRVATNRVSKMVVPAPLRLYTLGGRETGVWGKFSPYTTGLVLKGEEEIGESSNT